MRWLRIKAEVLVPETAIVAIRPRGEGSEIVTLEQNVRTQMTYYVKAPPSQILAVLGVTLIADIT